MDGTEPFSLDIRLEGGDFRGGAHPVRMGIPLPRGRLRDAEALCLASRERKREEGRDVDRDVETLARWPDGSLKWVLLRFLARAGSDGRPLAYRLAAQSAGSDARTAEATLTLRDTGSTLEIDTGRARFSVDKQWLYPLRAAACGGVELLELAAVPDLLRDEAGTPHRFRIRTLEVEHAGRVQADIFVAGDLLDAAGAVFCRGECRLYFSAGTALVKLEFALWNPRPARHPGGLWDLGDPGSVRFRSCRFAFPLAPGLEGGFSANLDPADPETLPGGEGPLSVHQSASGNDSWRSLSLVDRNNRPSPRFRGYRFARGGDLREGKRANPVLLFRSPPGAARPVSVAIAMESFWEAFPNRLSAEGAELAAEPFPAAEEAVFELQGGEMAASVLWLDFDAPADASAALAQARAPAVAALPPAAYAASGCFPYLAAPVLGADPFWNGLSRDFLDGPSSIYARRERFEEFGWRNFGEIPADHERAHYVGTREFVSHYNNQYDWILAALLQFAGGGDPRWFSLGAELSRHVMHVDLYRTQGDKSAYNGGYFWHTAHYMHAGTATHRSYSRLAVEHGSLPVGFGGGPSNEHNYTTGLLLYHYLTGDRRARRCVLQLSDWVERMQDGSRTVFRFLSANPTGFATSTRDLAYQGPGRGGGYSINACLDAAALTGEARWLGLAERYLRICLGPGDDPDALELLDRERRWSYVVFLQSVGKFLDAKLERGELDAGFDHARACLLKLADWMAEKEYPYLDNPQELEFPTSTWAAQDLRKVCVFLFAAKYGPGGKEAGYRAQADRFLASSKAYLQGYDDRDSARNLVLALITVPMYGCAATVAGKRPEPGAATGFGNSIGDSVGKNPGNIGKDDGTGTAWNLGLAERAVAAVPGQRFVPQKIEAISNAKKILATLGVAAVPILLKLWARKRSGGDGVVDRGQTGAPGP